MNLSPADRELLDHLASQAGQVLRNARLNADLEARLAELALQAGEIRRSRQRIVAAQDDERRALERNIHDGAQQHLVALAVKLKLARTLASRAPEKGASMLAQLREEVQDTLTALRDLAAGVYPAALEEKGVAGALEEQVKSSPVPVMIRTEGLGRYPLEGEATVYFCCLEALQNVAKYADAKQVLVTLSEKHRPTLLQGPRRRAWVRRPEHCLRIRDAQHGRSRCRFGWPHRRNLRARSGHGGRGAHPR